MRTAEVVSLVGGALAAVSTAFPWMRWTYFGRQRTALPVARTAVELGRFVDGRPVWTTVVGDPQLVVPGVAFLSLAAVLAARPFGRYDYPVVAGIGAIVAATAGVPLATVQGSIGDGMVLVRAGGIEMTTMNVRLGIGVYLALVGGLLTTAGGLTAWLVDRAPRWPPERVEAIVQEELLAGAGQSRLPAILAVAFLLRALVALRFPGGAEYDLVSYRLVGEAVLRGENVYVTLPHRYPYFPGWMVIEAAIVAVSGAGLPFPLVARVPGILGDVALVGVIYHVLRSGRSGSSLAPETGAALHAANPAAIAVVGGHGQFDSLPFLALFVAILLAARSAWDRSAVALGVGILLKPIPGFMGPLFLAARSSVAGRLRYLVVAGAPTALLSIPFLLATPRTYLERTVGYRSDGLVGWYGSVKLAARLLGNEALAAYDTPLDTLVLTASKVMLVVGVLLVAWWYYRRQDTVSPWRASLLVVTVFYAVSAGAAPQYLYWAMPLLPVVALPRWFRGAYVGTAFGTLALRYLTWYGLGALPPALLGVPSALAARGSFLLLNTLFWLVAVVGVGVVATAGRGADVPLGNIRST